MYALFKLHGWKPSDYYDMPRGEQIVTEAFLRQEAEDLKHGK